MNNGNFIPKEDVDEYLDGSFNIRIYKDLENNQNLFKPLDFFNILYEQKAVIRANKDRPLAVIDHLLNLKLTEYQLRFLLYYLLRLFDSYDVPMQTRILFSILDEQLRCCRELIEEEYERLDKRLYPDPEIDIPDGQNATLPDSNAETEFSQPPIKEELKQGEASQRDSSNTLLLKNKQTIERIFNRLGRHDEGWKYAFPDENDYNEYVDLLAKFFSHEEYSIPTTKIRLKRNTRSQVAKTLGTIHKELLGKDLKKDERFFQIARTLDLLDKEYPTDYELYKALTKELLIIK